MKPLTPCQQYVLSIIDDELHETGWFPAGDVKRVMTRLSVRDELRLLVNLGYVEGHRESSSIEYFRRKKG